MPRKIYSLSELAEHFGGRVLGDSATMVHQVGSLQKAGPGQIAFLSGARYRSRLADTRASAVVVGTADADATQLPRIVTDNPYAFFAKVSALLNPPPLAKPGCHPSAVIGEGAQIDQTAQIGPYVTIGPSAVIGARTVIMEGCHIGPGVSLGEEVLVYPSVVIYRDCVLGSRVIVHSGVVIGADGFGIAPENGRWIKIPQLGRVVIGDDVEIGANTTIDRGALDDTVIGEGVKLDNQIQVAHNVRIGEHTAIAAGVAIAGSTTIGARCRIGGCTGIVGHINIVDDVEISSFTMISKSIRSPGSYSGIFPFTSSEQWRKNAVRLRHLDELARKVDVLQHEIDALKGKIDDHATPD